MWINKIKQALHLRFKADIERDLEQARAEEAAAQQDFVTKQNDYSATHDEVLFIQNQYTEQYKRQQYICSQASTMFPERVVACQQAKQITAMTLDKLKNAKTKDTAAKRALDDAQMRYDTAIRRRMQLEQELADYKYPI